MVKYVVVRPLNEYLSACKGRFISWCWVSFVVQNSRTKSKFFFRVMQRLKNWFYYMNLCTMFISVLTLKRFVLGATSA